MKAYIAIKYFEDNRNKSDIDTISIALDRHGIEHVCFFRDVELSGEKTFEAQELMRMAFKEIDSSDLVIVDLTSKGVGLGIEAGYAYAKGLPIITIARTGADISKTLIGISVGVISYDSEENLFDSLRPVLIKIAPKTS